MDWNLQPTSRLLWPVKAGELDLARSQSGDCNGLVNARLLPADFRQLCF